LICLLSCPSGKFYAARHFQVAELYIYIFLFYFYFFYFILFIYFETKRSLFHFAKQTTILQNYIETRPAPFFSFARPLATVRKTLLEKTTLEVSYNMILVFRPHHGRFLTTWSWLLGRQGESAHTLVLTVKTQK
jgi:hypothetical protein